MRRRPVALLACAAGPLLLSGAVAGGAAVAPVVAAPAPAGPVPVATAVTCDPNSPLATSDLDGDLAQDAPVGVPSLASGAGGVDLHYSGSVAAVLDAAAIGAGTGAGDRFGAAVLVTDVDLDGCADLVVGAPGEGQSKTSDGSGGREGQVHIVFGGPGGVSTTDAVTLPHASSEGDEFGTALAVDSTPDGPGTDLYVGAPGATVGAAPRAGAVFRYRLDPDPVHRVKVTLREVRHQGSPGVPGRAETGDRFGDVLSGSGDGVLVGDASEDVGAAVDAGAVWSLRVDVNGAVLPALSWSQDSAGVPGTAEAGDRFGAAVDGGVVGIPGEDLRSLKDAGAVQVFRFSPGAGHYTPRETITQDSPLVPGTAEAGDRFGAAVVVGEAFRCSEEADAAIGAPGEDIDGAVDAGSVTVVPVTTRTSTSFCRPVLLREGVGLPGGLDRHDPRHVGAVLGVVAGRTDADEARRDSLLVGVPMPASTGVPGSVLTDPDWFVTDGVVAASFRLSSDPVFAGYGAVLNHS